jgi:hypothetical protein
MAARRNKHGLTAKQDAFAVNYACKGMTKADAYRLAYNTTNMKDKQVYEEACKLSKHPKVTQRANELLDEMQVDDIVSAQKILRSMLDTAESAAETGQLGVAMQANDRLMRHKALLTDRVLTSREGPGLDDDIVKTLAQGDPRKERQLRAIIGSDDVFAPLEVVEDDITEPDEDVEQAK